MNGGLLKMNKILGYRKMIQMSQEEMAERMKINKSSYWRKENGYAEFKDREKIIFRDTVRDFLPQITIDEIFFGG